MAFVRPVTGPITQVFGCTGFGLEPAYTWHGVFCSHFHGGIDYSAVTGTPVYAASSGYVREQGWDISIAQGGGISVWLQHGPNLHTVYAHLSQSLVSNGQQVVAGQRIGLVGATGNVTGSHLHFAVWTNTVEWGFEVDDPAKFLVGGSSADDTIGVTDDIPWIEPLSGSLVRLGLCIPQQDGTYGLPSMAQQVLAVYYDRILVSPSQYSVTAGSGGTLFIQPLTEVDAEVEVRADYIV